MADQETAMAELKLRLERLAETNGTTDGELRAAMVLAILEGERR